MSSIDIEYMDEEEAINLKHDLSQLIKSPGWLFIEKFLQDRVKGRNEELLRLCPSDLPEFVQFARIKGGIEEAELLPIVVKAVISDLDRQLKELTMDQEEEE